MDTIIIRLFSPGRKSTLQSGLLLVLLSFFAGVSVAQDTTSIGKKLAATIQLSFHKNADLTKTASISVMAVRNDKHIVASNAHVNFYIQNKTEQQLFQKLRTNRKGMASVDLPADLPLDATDHFTLTAKIENDSLYEDTEEQVTNTEVTLSIQLKTGDTANVINAIVTETVNEEHKGVKDVDIKFYVQRLFGIMPLAEENTVTTGDEGLASFIFPKDIPGDTAGNITVVARIEDSDNYGNVESIASAPWGVPLAVDRNPFPRALWLPYAPPTLIAVICILFGGVWCAYSFMFYQLRKIKRESMNDKQKNYS